MFSWRLDARDLVCLQSGMTGGEVVAGFRGISDTGAVQMARVENAAAPQTTTGTPTMIASTTAESPLILKIPPKVRIMAAASQMLQVAIVLAISLVMYSSVSQS
jgi:hypothetical protein